VHLLIVRNTSRHRRRPTPAAVLLATVRGSTGDVVLAGLLALAALPGVVVLLVDWLPGTPLVGLGLLVPGAVVVGGERLTRATGGPDIHDRQLDRIVAALVVTAAAMLTGAGLAAGGTTLRSSLVLATPLLAVGLITLLHGTRRLWQQRAAPVLLAVAWPVPWESALAPVEAAVGPAPVTAAVAGLVGAVLVVLVVRPRRGAVRRLAVVGPAPVSPLARPRRDREAAPAMSTGAAA
jgi:hypothetical protein